MDIATFIVEMAKVLVAWPTAILVAIYLLREHLRDLATSLKKVRYGDFEIEFHKGIQEVQHDVGALTEVLAKSVPQDQQLLDLIDTHPRLAVLEAWKRVDASLQKHYPPPGGGVPKGLYWISKLSESEGAGKWDIVQLYDGLRWLRRLAEHKIRMEIKKEDALSYVNMSCVLLNEIEKIENVTGK